MNKIKYILTLALGVLIFTSCELDNFEGPSAELNGSILDERTGAFVEQDIIRGCVIELREHGYDPVGVQELILKNDGTYRNSRLFAATYEMRLVKTNFVPMDSFDIEIKGVTTKDFNVTPYIRINSAVITRSGTKIIANFKVEQYSDTVNVSKIGLYAHRDPAVGDPMQFAKTELTINGVVNPDDEYVLEIDTKKDIDFVDGGSFFFRIGALIDLPEARLNYVPAVRVEL